MERRSPSKRLRFEIFKRDGFTCQYCGAKPPDVVLEIDHIDPHSQGGETLEFNLVTSCFDCNRGKANKKLGSVPARPDADIEFLAAQQEIAEARRFLTAKAELDLVREELVGAIQDHWNATLQMDGTVPADKIVVEWLGRYSPEEITQGIDAFLPTLRRQHWKFQSEGRGFTDAIRYVSGILRNRAEARIA